VGADTGGVRAGFELSLIDEAYTSIIDDGTDLKAQGWETSPFLIFLRTIPGRFYPIAMLALQLMLILTTRDFGPMFKAEQRAIREGKVHADDANPGQVQLLLLASHMVQIFW
jgi:Na+/H+ antiporter NhaC